MTRNFQLRFGTAEEWKRKIYNPSEYGDEVVLNLASNLLSLNIIIVPAFKESGVYTGLGITLIKPLDTPKHPPVILFYYSDSDFVSPHYQSVRPRSEVNVLRTFLTETDGSQAMIQDTFSTSLDVSDRGLGPKLTVENFDNIPVMLDNDR